MKRYMLLLLSLKKVYPENFKIKRFGVQFRKGFFKYSNWINYDKFFILEN